MIHDGQVAESSADELVGVGFVSWYHIEIKAVFF